MTFDDGPGVYTEQLLSILAANNLKVSFFYIGRNVDQYPEYALAAYQAGHHIAGHTYTHSSLPTLSYGDQLSEMQKTNDAIFKAIGKYPFYMRPPYGDYDQTTLAAAASLKLKFAIWDSDTNDEAGQLTGTQILNNYKKLLPNDPTSNSAIFLQHEIHQATVLEIQKIIDYIQSLGYKIVTLPECLADAVCRKMKILFLLFFFFPMIY